MSARTTDPQDAFRAALLRDGCEVLERHWPTGYVAPEHAHDFDARLMVTEGSFTLTVDGTARTYAAGETFTVPAGRRHAEAAGPGGVRLLIGRRHPAP